MLLWHRAAWACRRVTCQAEHQGIVSGYRTGPASKSSRANASQRLAASLIDHPPFADNLLTHERAFPAQALELVWRIDQHIQAYLGFQKLQYLTGAVQEGSFCLFDDHHVEVRPLADLAGGVGAEQDDLFGAFVGNQENHERSTPSAHQPARSFPL